MLRFLTVDGVIVPNKMIEGVPRGLPISLFRLVQVEALLSGHTRWRMEVARRLCQRWRKAGLIAAGPQGVWFWFEGAREWLVSGAEASWGEGNPATYDKSAGL